MSNSNFSRDKYIKLIQLLELRTKEVEQLKSQIVCQPPLTNPVIVTVDAFRKVLVTAHRNNAAHIKPKVTSRKQGYVDICYRNFMDLLAQELQEGRQQNYKDILLTLGFADAASFTNGGIPARVEGKTVRVVRIPQPVFNLLTESEVGQRDQ